MFFLIDVVAKKGIVKEDIFVKTKKPAVMQVFSFGLFLSEMLLFDFFVGFLKFFGFFQFVVFLLILIA